jgi:tetratricopeptide (TPR) repeat protein
MNRMQGAILFFIFPLVLISQVKTPFVTYDYQSDSRYKKELEFLKKKESGKSTAVIRSIAELSYYYNDWDTAIDYYKHLIVNVPTAENYFKLGVAAARKSLEVAQFFSVSYVVSARKLVLKAHEMEPRNKVFLNLLIQLYAEIPTLLGGSMAFAEKKADELMAIDSLGGRMMQGYLFELKNDFKASKSLYVEVFTDLKKKTTDSREWISQIEKDLIFKLGRAAAEYKIESESGVAALNHYIENFDFSDIYPLEWAYYYQSKIYFYENQPKNALLSIQKALEINSDFEEGLAFLKAVTFE